MKPETEEETMNRVFGDTCDKTLFDYCKAYNAARNQQVIDEWTDEKIESEYPRQGQLNDIHLGSRIAARHMRDQFKVNE